MWAEVRARLETVGRGRRVMCGCAIPGVPWPWVLGRGAEAFLWRDRGRNLVDAGLALPAAHRLHLGVSPRKPGAPW